MVERYSRLASSPVQRPATTTTGRSSVTPRPLMVASVPNIWSRKMDIALNQLNAVGVIVHSTLLLIEPIHFKVSFIFIFTAVCDEHGHTVRWIENTV